MKKHFNPFGWLLAVAGLLTACGEKADFLQSTSPATGARVKFYHVAPDAPGVVVYVNDKVLSGVNTTPPATPAALTYFGSFPNQDYALVAPGTANVKVAVAATSTTPEATAFTGALPVEDGKYYSVFVTGIAPTYEAVVTTDNLKPADGTKAYVRVVNLVSGSPAGGYELTVNGKSVATAASYKTVSDFVPIDAAIFGSATQAVTVKNGATTLTLTGGIAPLAGRFYTVVVRGVAGNAKTPPTPSLSTNR